MEVHHHTESVHEAKTFKDYFLEFLMIFLAVSLGFLAESLRESIYDHQSEKEYIIELKKNLVSDTVNLNTWIPALYARMDDFDTLMHLLQTPGPTTRGGDMYYLARIATRVGSFEPNDNTILELKNSGNFRLIRKQNVIDGLMNYEKLKEQYVDLYNLQLRENDRAYPLIGSLFDARVFDKMLVTQDTTPFNEKAYAMGSKNYLKKVPGNPQLRNHDPEKINLLIYYLHQRKASFFGEIRFMKAQKIQVANLITLLNKEYHLSD